MPWPGEPSEESVPSVNSSMALSTRNLRPEGGYCRERCIPIGRATTVVGRPSDAHQPASLSDGEAAGPAITDIGALLGNRLCWRAPFKNSISSANHALQRRDLGLMIRQ